MTASVAIGPEKNLPAVARAAGQNDRDKWWYERGRFYVDGVTQAALDAAAAAAVDAVPPTIEERFDPLAVALGRLLMQKGVITRAELRQAAQAVLNDRD